jgi:hypothetical protein
MLKWWLLGGVVRLVQIRWRTAWRGIAVSLSDEEENRRAFGLNEKQEGLTGSSGFSWCAASEQEAHQDTEVEVSDVDEIAFLEIFAAAQPSAAHSATIQDVGKAAFDHLAALAHGGAPVPGFERGAIGVDCHRGLSRDGRRSGQHASDEQSAHQCWPAEPVSWNWMAVPVAAV